MSSAITTITTTTTTTTTIMPAEKKRRPLSWVLPRPKSLNTLRSPPEPPKTPRLEARSKPRPTTSSYRAATPDPDPDPGPVPVSGSSKPTIKKVNSDLDPDSDGDPATEVPPVLPPPEAAVRSPRPKRENTTSEQAPRHNPFATNQGRFLQRLQTYDRTHRWTARLPDIVNEVQWAKHGWSCTGTMTCTCLYGCEQDVIVQVPPDIGGEYDAEEDNANNNHDGHPNDEHSARRRVLRNREVRRLRTCSCYMLAIQADKSLIRTLS